MRRVCITFHIAFRRARNAKRLKNENRCTENVGGGHRGECHGFE